MKERHDASARASALQVSAGIILFCLAAVLFTLPFAGASPTRSDRSMAMFANDQSENVAANGHQPSPTPTATPAPTPSPYPEDPYFILYQNFDYTVPPALPPGWRSSHMSGSADCNGQGTCAAGSDWVTNTIDPIEGPISVFHDAPGCVTDSYLDVTFGVPAWGNIEDMEYGFSQSFDFEEGRDGGVVEIAYDGGCFVDINAVGGSANYNGTIATGFRSPIAGRPAFTGNSGGTIGGGGSLPASAKGHLVTLRFRLATDCSGSGGGWRIDDVNAYVFTQEHGTPAPTPSTPSPTPPPTACITSEGFDDVGTLTSTGWVLRNDSGQFRFSDWSNGDPGQFPAHDGAPNSYIAVNSSTGCGTLSNWLFTPPVYLADGAVLTFWTRTVNVPTRPDRLQVWLSPLGTLLLDINPAYTTTGYPNVWTQYSITLSGIGPPVTGSLGFRYYVENGGPNGINSDYIGIDSVSYNCNEGEQTPTPPPGTPSPTPITPTPSPSAGPTPAAQALNLSTRLLVGTGNDVGIGGFIITGTAPKQVLLRGLGPSLDSAGVTNPLADPVLELRDSSGTLLVRNDNWCDSPPTGPSLCPPGIIATGAAPTDPLESAILTTLNPGSYTAILSGKNNGTGVGLVEVYDLSEGSNSNLGNISTRGMVGTGSDIVIAGFILGGGSSNGDILVRGLGSSLISSGVSNALANPTLELRDSSGAVVAANDDWQSGPPVSLPPTDPLESAIEMNLSPGAYTALLSGVDGGTGVGLVEVYDRGSPSP